MSTTKDHEKDHHKASDKKEPEHHDATAVKKVPPKKVETPPGKTAPSTSPKVTEPVPATPTPEPAPVPATPPPVMETDVPLDSLVAMIDEADARFAHIGGSSLNWVERAFLPVLKEHNVALRTYL